MPSRYERLARDSWKKGDFKADPVGSAWQQPELRDEPKDLRDRLRAEMERIAQAESERLSTDTKTQEGVMKLAKFVKFREEKFGAVLFETRQEKVYTLNPTGAAVVREILAGHGADVLQRLKDKYDDPSGSMETQAKEFIADLKDKGLLSE